MNEKSKKIKELRDEVKELLYEIHKLQKENSNYYIGVYSIGNGDYWDEYYCQLGFITEETAKRWTEVLNEEEYVYEVKYFEVTEEIYHKYGDWRYLDELKASIRRYNRAIKNLEGVDSFYETVERAIEDLAKEIGIGHLSFMHPTLNDVCLEEEEV